MEQGQGADRHVKLHGIDVLGGREDGLEFLQSYQRDLRRPVTTKTAALRATVEQLKREGYRFVTLAEAARCLDPELKR